MITEIAIIGAGPGGSAASLSLSRAAIPHVILDKAVFPRDKVCGDAFSHKVISALNKIDPEIVKGMPNKGFFLDSWGVTFVAPNGIPLEVPFGTTPSDNPKDIPGFISTRMDFDQYLVQRLDCKTATMISGAEVKALEYDKDGIKITYKKNGETKSLLAQLVIGAEGDRSIVAKKLAGHRMDPKHYCAGIRAYFENVSNIHPKNFIELHFLSEVLPGYLWIFPLPGNRMNVGMGIPSSIARKKHVNIKSEMSRAISENPKISHRFKNARCISEIRGWGLPLGSKKRPISGKRFMLIGDAASLIDPFTGEGIGNAMISGHLAAIHAKLAVEQGDFSAELLSDYDDEVYSELWKELKLSHTLQKLVRSPWLFNFLVKKASKNTEIQDVITNMFSDVDLRAKLRSPSFYFRLLTE